MGNIKCSPNGPDICPIRHLKCIKYFCKSHKWRLEQSSLCPSISININCPTNSLYSSLLRHDLTTPCDCAKEMKVMKNIGATLVVVEGPLLQLNCHNDLTYRERTKAGNTMKKKPCLIPHAKDVVAGIGQSSFIQRFHVKNNGNPFLEAPCQDDYISSFDEYMVSDFGNPMCTKCYDVSMFPNGLIFLSREMKRWNLYSISIHPTIKYAAQWYLQRVWCCCIVWVVPSW